MKGLKEAIKLARARRLAVSNRKALPPSKVHWDNELEDKLIFLISSLEQLMIKWLEKSPEERASGTLQLLAEMVNRTLDMAEKLPQPGARAYFLAYALNHAGQSYPLVRALPAHGYHISVETIAGAGNNSMEWLVKSRSSLRQVCQGLVLALESCFSLFERFFYLPETRERWKTIYQILILELKQVVVVLV